MPLLAEPRLTMSDRVSEHKVDGFSVRRTVVGDGSVTWYMGRDLEGEWWSNALKSAAMWNDRVNARDFANKAAAKHLPGSGITGLRESNYEVVPTRFENGSTVLRENP